MSRMKRAGVVEPEVILKQFDMFSTSPESINDSYMSKVNNSIASNWVSLH